MKPNSNKIWLISAILVGLLGAFAGGTMFGVKFANKLYHPSLSADYYAKTIVLQLALEKLDTNEIEKGHKLIALEVNSGIRTLDQLIAAEKDDEMKIKIKSLLNHIALHRDEFPKYYDTEESSLPENTNNIPNTRDILEKYKSKS